MSTLPIEPTGTIVHLKGYGLIRVFKVDTPEGDIEYWATNDLQMDELTRLKYTEWSWTIEEYHRGIKQFVGIERGQVRSARTQRKSYWFSAESLSENRTLLLPYRAPLV